MWIGLSIAFIGVIVILRPNHGIIKIGAIFGLMSGIFGAIGSKAIRHLHRYREPPLRIMSFYSIFTVIISLIITLSIPQTYAIVWTGELLFLLLMVGLTTVGFQLCFTYANRHAPTRYLMPFLYLSTIITIFPDHLIWHFRFSITSYIGMFLIIVGTVLKVLLFPKKDVMQEENKP